MCRWVAGAHLSRRQGCCGRGVGSAKAAEGLSALLMLLSRLLPFQELSGRCRLGDLHSAHDGVRNAAAVAK